MRGKRSQSREAALKVLYQLDVTKDSPKEGLRIFFRHHRIPVDSQPFVENLVQGTVSRLSEIDKLLAKHTTNWRVDRMSIVDRNILRLAVFELLYGAETPPKVVINEAVELAKRFGSAESGKFVNGVLDSVHKTAEPETAAGEA